MICKSNNIPGFTLIEIMIAISLGVILLAGVGKIYLSVKRAYRATENIARLQETGRFLTYILAKNIRVAGYAGCAKSNSNIIEAIRGFNSKDLPEYLRGKVADGTDVIVIQKADSKVTYLTEDVVAPTDIIEVESNPADKNNPELLISDCAHADLFNSTTFGRKIIHADRNFNHNYKKSDTEVGRFTEIAYFIGKGNRFYSVTNGGRAQELADGVANMQIQYGVDNNGNGKVDGYYSANEISDWKQVVSVYITLFLNFEKNKIKRWKTYISLRE